jgi:hypothetical protein
MLKRIACGVVVFLFAIVGPAAAGEEEESQQLVILQEYAVHPDGMAQFEASLKTILEAAAEHGIPYGWDVYSSDEMSYTITYWVEGLAGVEALHADWEAFSKRWGEEAIGKWNEGFLPSFDHLKTSLWHPRPDLSYLPENRPTEVKFIYWGMMYVKPGHMEAVEKSIAAFKKVYTEHEAPHAWNAAVGGIGTESPVLGYLEWAASASAFWTRVDEIHENEELTKAGEEIWKGLLPHLRGFEFTTGTYRKDLSWHPEKKAEAEEK